MNTLSRLLSLDQDSSLIVGVISFAHIANQPPGPGDATVGKDYNPISAFHRKQMIEHIIRSRKLQRRVSVLCLPRTDLFWPIASDILPPNRQICVPIGEGPQKDFELEKAKSFTDRGEDVLTLDIGSQPASSGRLIRQVAARGGDIRPLVPPEVLEYLKSNDLMSLLRGET